MFFERHQGGELALLVHPEIMNAELEDPVEFRELVLSAGLSILDLLTVVIRQINPRYFLGTGKLEELVTFVQESNVEVLLINYVLSASQEKNLEKKLGCKVIDRTGLILDIFAQRAQTHEGRLQVELAQLRHLSTRLVRGWTHLERQKGGIGLRGPGETQLETDRRLLQIRVKSIEKKLNKVLCQREQSRLARKRAEVPMVSCIGYTNAGKSTLFNLITSSDVLAVDQLFATLDTTVRRYILENFGRILLSDTVGFVRNLPHNLIKAFRATLEESTNADLLLHVIDAACLHRESTIEEVKKVLTQIGIEQTPVLEVYNKIDLLDGVQPKIDYNEAGIPVRVWLSAATGAGVSLLPKAITQLLSSQTISGWLLIPKECGRLKARLYACKAVKSEMWQDDGYWRLDIQLPQVEFDNLLKKEQLTAEIDLLGESAVINLKPLRY